MDSTRQKKYARLFQKDLGEIFQQNAHKLFDGAFITVTQVKVSPDLSIAKVYLSFMMVKNKEAMLAKVNEHHKTIKQQLAARIKNQARIIPELKFFIDDTEEVAAKVEELFKNLHIPPPSEDDDDDQIYVR
ncbi:MAG: 30S ribosome-binding factor RbfA [Flammeovirgaceae bacterium]|nr:30S ribosome-binding factor RbfA [Flammeovirgaceae bacterium]MDW8286917.1 30S ribosome-binding factor RbfA [Flammeovirgaceae bacterium]